MANAEPKKHFNVQVHVQEVTPKQPALDYRGTTVATPVSGVTYVEKSVVELFSLAVTAPTEAEAFRKAINLLETASPDTITLMADDKPVGTRPVSGPHLHRASCDDASGNQVCGYPAGPSIAG